MVACELVARDLVPQNPRIPGAGVYSGTAPGPGVHSGTPSGPSGS